MTGNSIDLGKIKAEDIFRYVVGNTNYCPIEQKIDPTIFEVFEEDIYNHKTKKLVHQDESFIFFQKHLSKLRFNAKEMHVSEINRICVELEDCAPKFIKI